MVGVRISDKIIGSIDPDKGITDVVNAEEVDDTDSSHVSPCYFIAPENNICVCRFEKQRVLMSRMSIMTNCVHMQLGNLRRIQ